jgi:hypothetical protein
VGGELNVSFKAHLPCVLDGHILRCVVYPKDHWMHTLLVHIMFLYSGLVLTQNKY